MLDCKAIYDVISAQGIDFFAGVPDSTLKALCAYITDHTPPERNISTANEGGAIALAVGHYMATGKPAMVYMQNSGLGNAFNPLTSLADEDVYGVPMLMVVGWRGEPGVKDEPQHAKMGKITRSTLEVLGIPHVVLPDEPEAAAAAITTAVATIKESGRSYALVVRKGIFAKYKLATKSEQSYPMSREQAIATLLDALPANTPIVSTTGKASRELFELRKQRGESHDSDFLTVGSMGHSSHIALGAALAHPDRDLYCIDGDGAAIMHLGGLAIIASLEAKNFKHVIINNGAHDSVGGQPTRGFAIDLCAIASAAGYPYVRCVDTAAELPAACAELAAAAGPALLEIRVKVGSRSDLGRPTNSARRTKELFMEFLRR